MPRPSRCEPLEPRRLLSAVAAPWRDTDIGPVGRIGSATVANGVYTVAGSGTDIVGVSDAFNYLYQPLTNNGSITTQVTAVGDTDPWAKSGLMLRETIAADSRFVLLAVTPGNGIALQVRSGTHQATPLATKVAGTAGAYLRLTRAGSTITAAYSTNGTTYTTVGTVTMSLPNTVDVGLAVSAHNNTKLSTSTFAHLAVATTNTAASPWSVGASDYVARWESDTAVVGGKMYVFGGYTDRQLHATTESDVYTPATNTWAHVAAEPYPVTHAATVAVGTTIYLVGGYLGQQTANNPPLTAVVQAYDTVHNSWSLLPSLPFQVAAGGVGYVGHSLYFFGGILQNRASDSGKTLALDLTDVDDGWHYKADLPDARNHVGYATVNGLVYAIGGLHLEDEVHGQDAEVDVYNPVANTWAKTTPLPFPWSHFNDATLVVNGKIVIVAGQTNGGFDGTYIPDVDVYDPATKKWSALTPLPEARQAAAGGYVNGTLVVIDGAVDNQGGWPQQQVWTEKLGV